MRRLLLLTVLACLVAPPAAFALHRSAGDGTLVVRHGDGMLRLDVSGAVIGLVQGGQLDIISPTADSCDGFDVWGADREKPPRSRVDGATVCHYVEFLSGGTPQPIRFRVVLGRDDTLIIRRATDFSVSAVGRGTGLIKAATGPGAHGVYSLDGGHFFSLPDETESFTLGATLR